MTSQTLHHFSPEQLAQRNAEFGLTEHWYTDDELDALEEHDPLVAARSAQRQAKIARIQQQAATGDIIPVTAEGLADIMTEIRAILLRDGGDIELISFTDTSVRVRLKGACAGCPNAMLDLKNVVETLIRRTYPQIQAIQNTY